MSRIERILLISFTIVLLLTNGILARTGDKLSGIDISNQAHRLDMEKHSVVSTRFEIKKADLSAGRRSVIPPVFEMKDLFESVRIPNITVATDGTIYLLFERGKRNFMSMSPWPGSIPNG